MVLVLALSRRRCSSASSPLAGGLVVSRASGVQSSDFVIGNVSERERESGACTTAGKAES